AKALLEQSQLVVGSSWFVEKEHPPTWPLFEYQHRDSEKLVVEGLEVGGDSLVRVVVPRATHEAVAHKLQQLGEYQPELIFENLPLREIDPRSDEEVTVLEKEKTPQLVTVRDGIELESIAAFRLLAARIPARHPILLKDTLNNNKTDSYTENLLASSIILGSLLCDGIGDAILIRREAAPGASLRLAYNILQAAGVRIFKTDYVACPSCGRTLFNLQETTARIRAATNHLKGVRIAIMGCIVNGPGEMADADFGYVGGAPGKINLYVGKKAVKFNIPQAEAVDRLVELIKQHGKWVGM
ncbi:MAG: flavodoxin-dependent (E)-4-hydroxy-3-methylbut-2-enyl-diphosphate synthase, partial [Verrucomicrobiota bacterium]